MTRINSKWTFVLKKVFPLFWLSIMLSITLAVSLSNPNAGDLAIVLVSMIIVLGAGSLVYFKLIYDAVDLVFLDGDTLILKNKDKSISIQREDVNKYSYRKFMNPHKVTLHLHQQTDLGVRVSFFAPMNWVPFRANRELTEWLKADPLPSINPRK